MGTPLRSGLTIAETFARASQDPNLHTVSARDRHGNSTCRHGYMAGCIDCAHRSHTMGLPGCTSCQTVPGQRTAAAYAAIRREIVEDTRTYVRRALSASLGL